MNEHAAKKMIRSKVMNGERWNTIKYSLAIFTILLPFGIGLVLGVFNKLGRWWIFFYIVALICSLFIIPLVWHFSKKISSFSMADYELNFVSNTKNAALLQFLAVSDQYGLNVIRRAIDLLAVDDPLLIQIAINQNDAFLALRAAKRVIGSDIVKLFASMQKNVCRYALDKVNLIQVKRGCGHNPGLKIRRKVCIHTNNALKRLNYISKMI